MEFDTPTALYLSLVVIVQVTLVGDVTVCNTFTVTGCDDTTSVPFVNVISDGLLDVIEYLTVSLGSSKAPLKYRVYVPDVAGSAKLPPPRTGVPLGALFGLNDTIGN
jgi:hypothetical protein